MRTGPFFISNSGVIRNKENGCRTLLRLHRALGNYSSFFSNHCYVDVPPQITTEPFPLFRSEFVTKFLQVLIEDSDENLRDAVWNSYRWVDGSSVDPLFNNQITLFSSLALISNHQVLFHFQGHTGCSPLLVGTSDSDSEGSTAHPALSLHPSEEHKMGNL